MKSRNYLGRSREILPAGQGISKAVVNVPMKSFILQDRGDGIAQSRVGRQVPISDRQFRRRRVVLPPIADFIEILTVAAHGILGNVSGDAVAGAGREKI